MMQKNRITIIISNNFLTLLTNTQIEKFVFDAYRHLSKLKCMKKNHKLNQRAVAVSLITLLLYI